MKERILFLSDLHDCHIHWYGTTTEARLEKMVKDVEAAGHFDQLIVMGDVSLDFWGWNEGGSYLQETPSRPALFPAITNSTVSENGGKSPDGDGNMSLRQSALCSLQ